MNGELEKFVWLVLRLGKGSMIWLVLEEDERLLVAEEQQDSNHDGGMSQPFLSLPIFSLVSHHSFPLFPSPNPPAMFEH